MVYSINIDITEIEERDIKQIDDIKDSTVVILADKNLNDKLTEYYLGIYKLIKNRNRVMLLIYGTGSKVSKTLAMLMYAYNQNDIYKLPNEYDLNTLNKTYISVLEEQQPDEVDVEMFIGSDVMAYSDAQILLAKLINYTEKEDYENINKLLKDKHDEFADTLGVLSYTRAVTEKIRFGSLKNKLNKVNNEALELKSKNDVLENTVAEQKTEIQDLKKMRADALKDVQHAQSRIEMLEKKLNQGTIIREYVTTNTKLISCKVKVILYFKEIARINYINSFIHEYYEYLTRILKKRTKLIIYVTPHAFLGVYKPIQSITSAEYVQNRQDIVNKMDKLVLIEPNPSVLQDTLTSEAYDIVIVYDRLKQEADIVTGNNVHKYFVVNSMKDINELKRKTTINMENVITNPGTAPEALTISYIDGYKGRSESQKLTAYMSMRNTGTDTGVVFDILTDATNIKMI